MIRRNSLAASLGVEPGEGPLVGLLFALSCAATAPYVLGFTGGNALFLAAYGAEGLPYTFMASAAVLVLGGALFARVQRRLPLGRLLVAPWLALLLLAALLYAGLAGGGPPWLTFALMIWTIVVGVFAELAFWALAGRLLNLAQGKRLFGLVGAGALLSRLVVYSLSALVVTAIGAVNLLLLAMGAMVVALGLLVATLRRLPARLPPAPGGGAGVPARAAGRAALRSRYIGLILSLVLIGELGYSILEYFFLAELALTFPDPDRLAQVLGGTAAVAFLLATMVSATLTGPILRRFGVRFGLLSEPLLVGLGMAAALAVGLLALPAPALFLVVLAAKTADDVSDSSVNKPSTQLLFQPMPAAERVPAQTLATSVVEPAAVGLTGLALIGLQALGVTGGAPLAGLILALTVVWLALALLAYREYVAALGRALSRRLVGSATITLDAAALGVVERALAGSRSVEVLSALDLLASERPALYAARLPALLAHPEPGVRREVVARIGALGLVEALPAVAGLAAREADPAVRAAAVAALGDLGAPPEAAMADPDPEVQVAALVGQLRHGDRAGAALALAALAASADPAERAVAARVAGAAGDGETLARLLADPAAPVRRAALRAAGPGMPPALWPAVIAALGDHQSRGAALTGLAAGGAAAMPAVVAALADPRTPAELRAHLARACGRIRGPAAVEALLGQLDAPDDDVREAAVAALRRCGYAAGKNEAPIRARIAAELALAEQSAAALADLEGEPRAALLRQALQSQLARQGRRAFTLLGFVVGPELARQLADGLAAPSAERRAYAAELLETRVRAELRAPFAPLVAGPVAGRLGGPRARLAALIAGPDAAVPPWVRTCALYTAGLIEAPELAAGAEALLDHRAPIVRELAAWAAGRLAAGPAARQRSGDGPPGAEQGVAMLTTVERVIILKGVGIFAATPDPVLAELAALLAEEELPAGRPVFAKGDQGSSLYVIVEGEVRVHDGESTLNHLGERDVFGEMALLDPAPRSASVTAVADTLLLRLDAEPFYELMDDRIEIARGIITVLTGRLRDRMRDLEEARRGQ